MIEKKDRKAGQLYALIFGSHSLVYCVEAGDVPTIKVIWPTTINLFPEIRSISWDKMMPVSNQYPSKHEITKMIFGEP